MTFDLIKLFFRSLNKLTYFTIEATGTLDLMNGQLWEEYLFAKNIKIFNFKFTLSNNVICDQDQNLLLESFRSSFWLEKQNWCVACEKGDLEASRPTIYSIPYFQPTLVFYPSKNSLPVTTAVTDIVSKRSIDLILTFDKIVTLPISMFNHVSSLTLLTLYLPPVDVLQSIVNLKQIQEIDVSLIRNFSLEEFQTLIDYMTNLKHIKMQYNPLFFPPLHIRVFTFVRKDKDMYVVDTNNIKRFCYLFFHVKNLEITVQSKHIIIQLLNQLHYLERIKIFCYQDYLLNIEHNWFLENVSRFHTVNFTYRITSSCLLLSLGYKKVS